MIDELVAFLRARYDDEEQIARAVPDHRQRRGELHWQEVDPESHPGLIGDQCGNVVTFGGPTGTGGWHAAHIARHDPARVLADIASKRRVLDRYEDAVSRVDDPHESRPAAVLQVREYVDFVLPALALPYADHPDYREEWRP